MKIKAKCDCCERTFRASKLKKNKVTGQMFCHWCNNKTGQNKFYTVPENKRISKYAITETEKSVLRMQGANVKRLCDGLKAMKENKKWKMKRELSERKETQEKEKQQSKKFLEGLK